MIAVETFDAGGLDGIVRAGERVADHHELVRRYRDKFGPDRPLSERSKRALEFSPQAVGYIEAILAS